MKVALPRSSVVLTVFALFAVSCISCNAADWQKALPGWKYEFPRDHGNHPDFKTEWWYFTGQLRDERGVEYGYQLTFFRQGVRPPGKRAPAESRFVVDHIPFAHFAVSDPSRGEFGFAQKISRGAFGEAGFEDGNRLAWIDGWTLEFNDHGEFHLAAEDRGMSVQLALSPKKPPVIHGEHGVSQKSDGAGNASHYYSLTRLVTTGELAVGGRRFAVQGESWFDHEWATNQLGDNQVGWDWFSVQLDDGSELMLYQLRLANGEADPNSGGTFVRRNGDSIHLAHGDYVLTPLGFWTSKATGARYPIRWRIEIPGESLDLTVITPLPSQELHLDPIAYWEGLIHVDGTRNGTAVAGHGYMELTGYAGPLVGLKSP